MILVSETLVMLFHPNFAQSRANRALVEGLRGLNQVELIDYYAEGQFDSQREVDRLLKAKRLIWQFPLQWYSTPSLMKEWQDQVLTRMVYLKYAEEGSRLLGKPLAVVATAGNLRDAYRSDGSNLFPLEQLLRPLEVTAHRCGLKWRPPHLIYRAHQMQSDELESAVRAYREYVQNWPIEAKLGS